jgi:Ca2+-binding RTX toxin-like protein
LVVANGSLLDFETNTSHEITVRTTDSGGLTFDETLTVSVTDIDETLLNTPPTDIALSNNTVAEESANNTLVGLLSATDPDPEDTQTFQLLDDAGGRFAVDGNELVVANGSLLDFETNTSHEITVRTTDSGGLTFDETLTVSVTDVNEPPTDIQLTNNTVEENSESETFIGELSASDPDASDTQTFELLDAADGRFAIDGNELVVADGELLDFDTDASHEVTIRATDSGGLTFDETFTIEVLDTNNPPIANDDTIATVEATEGDDFIIFPGEEIAIAQDTLLDNDSDPDGDPLDVINAGSAVNGEVEFDSETEEIEFTLTPGSTLPGSFQYTISDGNDGTATATVTVTPTDPLEALGGNDTVIANDNPNTIFGNEGIDVIDGGEGDDTLAGGEDGDTLSGDDGMDAFVFNNPAEGIDTILDFETTDDTILVSESGFGGGLTPGVIAPEQFSSFPFFITIETRFIYDTMSGALNFDPDGIDTLAPIPIATLDGVPSLNFTDIVVF